MRIARVILLALLAVSTLVGQDRSTGPTEEMVLGLEHRWIDESKAGRIQNASALLTKDYVYVWADGSIHQRSEYLADLGKSKWDINEISDTQVILHNDTAIVIGKCEVKAPMVPGSPSIRQSVTQMSG